MIKTTITRKYEKGELVEEIEVTEDDNNYVPTYPTYPIYPVPPTIKPWWQEPWTVSYSTSDHTYKNDNPSTGRINK
jgi:hypothetical protein